MNYLKKMPHAVSMFAVCAAMLAVIFVLTSFTTGSNWGVYLLVLLCPAMHFLMHRGMHQKKTLMNYRRYRCRQATLKRQTIASARNCRNKGATGQEVMQHARKRRNCHKNRAEWHCTGFAGPLLAELLNIAEMTGSILGAMCGLVFGFIIVILIDRSPGMRRKITPVITDIVKPYIGMSVTNKTYCRSCQRGDKTPKVIKVATGSYFG